MSGQILVQAHRVVGHCIACGAGGQLILGWCSLGCAHRSVEERAERERVTVDDLAQEIFRLTEQLRQYRQRWRDLLDRDHLVLG